MWPNGLIGDEFAPLDVPACGFKGELCVASSSKYCIGYFFFISKILSKVLDIHMAIL